MKNAQLLKHSQFLKLKLHSCNPSKNPSGWMPILDLAVRMASDNSVDFKWYKKPVATDYSILNRSAMPAATKRITLVQMGVTMLRNTRQRLHQLLRIPLMEQLAEKMMISGYPEDCRSDRVSSGVLREAGGSQCSRRGPSVSTKAVASRYQEDEEADGEEIMVPTCGCCFESTVHTWRSVGRSC